MFFLLKNMHIANHEVETTPYIYGENIESVIKSLEQSANLLFNWFKNNQMKRKEDKCQVLLSTEETVQVNIGTAGVNNIKCEKLLGVKIDCKLIFDDHIGNICKKAGAKLNALTRVVQHVNTEKKALNYECVFFVTI